MSIVMSPTPSPQVISENPPAAKPLAHASMLEDKVPAILKANRTSAVLAGSLLLVFFFFSYQRLWHTDLWGHLSYGRTIVETKSIPASEPLMPLAAGVPFVDTAWLSQIIGYVAVERLGLMAMSFLYAASITAIAGLVLFQGYRRSQSLAIALSGMALWLWGCWQHLSIVRPQLAGMLCFSLLLWMVTSRRRSAWHWWAVPVLFAAWANLHGSFPVGLVLLATMAVGRACDVGMRCGEWRAVQRDSLVRRFVLLLELAAVAVLVNPFGVRLYVEVLNISNNPNVAELVEWLPLQLRMAQGKAAAVTALILIVLSRWSPRRIRTAEALLLFGFGAAALWSSRMVVWWMPLAVTFGVMHASAIRHAKRTANSLIEEEPRNGRWSVIIAGCCWIGFALTPFGGELTQGFPFQEGRGSRALATENASPESKSETTDKGLKLSRLVSARTPLGVVEHLKKLAAKNELPKGQAFNTYEWGDYLLWEGPPGLRIFVGSHIQFVPREVWQDYITISEGAQGWEEMLDRYGVNLIVLDELTHDRLIRRLRESDVWKMTYKDGLGAVFVRKKPV